MKIAVTGANSSVGRNLLGHIAEQATVTTAAVVRSRKAASSLPAADNIRPIIAGYGDVAGLAEAFEGMEAVIHLAGILVESGNSSYQSANVDTTAEVVEAAEKAGVDHVVLVSVIGADAYSTNAYYRSKGEAEKIVRASGLKSTIIRTPILLGPGTAGAEALVKSATAGRAKLLGGGRHTVRPLDVDDLSRAILHACHIPPESSETYELTGPEPVRYADLVRRTAAMMGRKVRIASISVRLAKVLAGLAYLVKSRGMSPAVIDVITSSEAVAHNADKDLGLDLTPLEETLGKIIKREEEAAHDTARQH